MTRKYNQNLAGWQVGRLTVVMKLRHNNVTKWHCVCGCGNVCLTTTHALTTGRAKSCSECKYEWRSLNAKWLTRHPLFRLHHGMKRRCENPIDKAYKHYGGRGIRVCKRWSDGEGGLTGLECFALDMGERPSKKHSIDRIDNDGDYTPDNCRWATTKEQTRNRRTVRMLEFQGRRQSLPDWADELGLQIHCLWSRLTKSKWSVEQALTTPHRLHKQDDPQSKWA